MVFPLFFMTKYKTLIDWRVFYSILKMERPQNRRHTNRARHGTGTVPFQKLHAAFVPDALRRPAAGPGKRFCTKGQEDRTGSELHSLEAWFMPSTMQANPPARSTQSENGNLRISASF
ncbi:hypothetical protein B5F54_15400 [Anaeromassilibacillus sp. An250]|nr:hypothetical protein B5F54_15400 [Anaeromassilibacillus sp. An250]